MVKALIARNIVKTDVRVLTSVASRDMYNVRSAVGRSLLNVVDIIENQCSPKLGIKENLWFAPMDEVFRLVGRDERMVREFGGGHRIISLNRTPLSMLADEA